MIKFINNSNSDILIDFYGLHDHITIKPNKNFILNIDNDNFCFKVSECAEKSSIFMKVLGIILMLLLSIFLTILECIESESIQKNLKFSTKYELNDLDADQEHEIVIKNSTKRLVAFSASLNGRALNGTIDITEEDLKNQVKEYYQMEILKFSFLMLALFALVILILCSENSGKIFFGALLFLIACIPLFIIIRNQKKNKALIEDIRKKYCNTETIHLN
ncbi:MAG: hypothetical protein K2I73_02820 [Eubacterium sp.]|nr:hypothetical protein [Eubacterium sp.]